MSAADRPVCGLSGSISVSVSIAISSGFARAPDRVLDRLERVDGHVVDGLLCGFSSSWRLDAPMSFASAWNSSSMNRSRSRS